MRVFATVAALTLLCIGVSMAHARTSPYSAGCPSGAGYVMTRQGCIDGDVTNGVRAFKGIPFAAPPVGDLRWRAPAPAPVRDAVLQTRAFSARCVQPPGLPGPTPMSEDCLYLNVWTPANASSDADLPVMVFIHGGGNTSGSANQTPGGVTLYDGGELARRGNVVVVTIQYRLNVFGYLVHPALAEESGHNASGNYGLLDQIAAFHWVKDNIAAFGGDPARVLLFGESGGGHDVCALVASPLAAGLFSSAIMQSGGCVARTSAEMQAWSAGLVTSAGCANAPDAIACLRERDADDLLSGFEFTAVEPGGRIVVMSGPTVDGYVLPLSPVEALRTGRFNHVPFVIGINAHETASPLFRIDQRLTEAQYEAHVRALFPDRAGQVLQHYPVSDYASPRFALVALTTDLQFICPSRLYLEYAARAQGEPVYSYVYTHVMEGGPGRINGAAHGLELFFVFQAMDRLHRGYRVTDGDRRLERAALGYWTQFAARGDPNGGGLPNWRRFDPERNNYLDLSASPTMAAPLGGDRCDFLNTLTAGPMH
jgi:para-nitrobenzyl esterase